MSKNLENVLLLQGGGSLGAFGCGVYKALVKNITIDNIAPGMVLTPFNQQALDDPEVRKKCN